MAEKSSRIITVASGKGGVGKTSIVINTGLALTRMGYKVCVFDADTNLANINIMLRQTPEYTLEHVINGQKSVTEIMLQKAGLYVIPGASGISEFISFNKQQQDSFLQAIKTCQQVFDFIIIDSAAGISHSVLANMQIAQQNILVITPEPTSLTDAFSLLKVFNRQKSVSHLSVIVNQVRNERQAIEIYKRFSSAVKKYIGRTVDYLGGVARDNYFSSSIRLQNPLFLSKPDSVASQCFVSVADIISKRQSNVSPDKSVQQFVHSQSHKMPVFSEPNRVQVKTENDLKKTIIDKLRGGEFEEKKLQKILDLINQPPASFHTIKPVSDKAAMQSSIKYASLSAEI